MSLKNNFILLIIFFNMMLISCKGANNEIKKQFINDKDKLTKVLDSFDVDLNNDGIMDEISVIENRNNSTRTIIVKIMDDNNNYKIVAKNDKLVGCPTCGYQNGDPYIGLNINKEKGFDLELENQTLTFIYERNGIYLNKINVLEIKPTEEGIEENHIIIDLDNDSKVKLQNINQDLVYTIFNNKRKKDNQQCISPTIFKLPYNNTINTETVKYDILDCKIMGVDYILCGEEKLRYISLPKKDDIYIILVPMDCGDFPYRYYMTTIKNSKIIDKLYVEGKWYEPGTNEDNTIEDTRFLINENYIISVVTKKGGELKSTQKYEILDSGKFEKIK